MRRSLLPTALVLLLPVACKDDGDSGDSANAGTTGEPATTTTPAVDDGGSGDDGSGGSDTGPAVDPNAPTFYGDVLPIIIEECSQCHVDGGIAPFALEEYAMAKDLSGAIQVITENRIMPPFNANNDGTCNTFANARWLSDEQLDTIAAWVEGGAQEGDPSTPQPPHPEPSVLQGADIEDRAMPSNYVPIADGTGSDGYDDYQCFLVDLEIADAARYLVGYEVVPGNAATTHHLIGFLVNPESPSAVFGTNGDLMAQLDDATPDQPGWDCYGAAGNGVVPEGTPITWAPGGGAVNFPEGTGIRIDPGYVLVVQMHYNLLNGDGEDSSVLRMSWADSVEREAVNAFTDHFLATAFNGAPVEIPPGEESFVFQWDERIRNFSSRINGWEKVEILGLLPHMHTMGRRMQADIVTADETMCGIYVDRWNFDWQQGFMYDTPIIVDPDDTIQVTCEWDSSNKDTPTTPGLGTQNEMCLMGIYAAEAQ